ncbi:MAG TPA: hypothetical protein VEL28_07275 [Candidatus Binatia bacterium]|nr:hypothetical protein [Candidatus Binatia bacterium]
MISIRQALGAAFAVACLAQPSAAQVQSAEQQKCLQSTATASAKLAKARAKEYAKCLKSAAGEDLVGCSAEDCVASDASGKVGDALAKLRDISSASCRTQPDFAYRHPSLVGSVVVDETIGLFDDVLGPDLDDVAILKSEDARGAACQGKILKAATKLGLTMTSLYDACRKAAVPTVTSAEALADCLDAITADDSGKVAAAERGIDAAVAGTCAGLDMNTVLDGSCDGAPDLGDCVAERARCRACRRASSSDDLGTDCDLFDDGNADGSCTGVAGRCNGRADLCDRTFDEVAHPTTHNAYSSIEDDWFGPNQRYGLTRQLAEGITSMMLDSYEYEGGLWFCHGSCSYGGPTTIGKTSMVDGLSAIREHLLVDPESVVSIIFESYITEAQMQQAFTDAGLMPYLHEQPVGMPWPAMQQLVASGKRLIVFTDDSAASLPWHHYVWDFAWETPYSFESAEDFVCSINRGDMANSLYILNHFLTDLVGSPQLANQVNHNPLFEDRALQCQTESGRLPNFVTVDFYDIGDVFEVTDTLNGFAQCAE